MNAVKFVIFASGAFYIVSNTCNSVRQRLLNCIIRVVFIVWSNTKTFICNDFKLITLSLINHTKITWCFWFYYNWKNIWYSTSEWYCSCVSTMSSVIIVNTRAVIKAKMIIRKSQWINNLKIFKLLYFVLAWRYKPSNLVTEMNIKYNMKHISGQV